ncbi:Uu.00g106410.m01.CDS01 [Anthostomella pinea]|uniref:Uu.00g106410.m01.CDS01 n=1 Tax=Anthostomella pinea TaxID=933095 RepID=A0AAI8VF50_9PEZI|nr:Uu.00g106410.m01.CDS01 [Anthostomella pinea]
MLASAETVAPTATMTLYFDPLCDRAPISKPSQRSFKKHKVLPHPRNDRPESISASDGRPSSHSLSLDNYPVSNLDTRPSTPPRLRKGNRSIRSIRSIGPDFPPTPPAHSRTTSSSSQSALPSTPTHVASPVHSVTTVSVRSVPGTPPHQRSPPTPDVTPPQPERRPKAFRPLLADRIPSKAATDSRTESFTTARENLDSSDEEVKTTPRPLLSSSRTSQSTLRRLIDSRQRKAQDAGSGSGSGLGLGPESEDNLTPRTRQEFFTFDGDWASPGEVEQEWDDNLNRNVIVRKWRGPPKPGGRGRKEEVVEDVTVTPTNATKALRAMPLHEPSPVPLESTSKGKPRWTAPSASNSSMSTDLRRSSRVSSKSTVSTVVETILVDVLDVPRQRQKTLRHVRKQTALRDSSSEISPSPSSSAATSVRLTERSRRPRVPGRFESARSDSLASTGTANSIASRKARREVWKNGGIPVVVIPDRKASMKSTAPPSLRSMSSHRSRRTNSLGSVPPSSHSRAKDPSSYFDRPSRRGRSMSESDGSLPGDQRTIDYPPVVPIRTSSLSAPTSRNTSRAGSRAASLTAESLKAHNTLLEQEIKPQPPKVTVECAPPVEDMSSHSDQKQLQLAASLESHRDEHSNHKSLVDHNGDPFFGKRLTAHNTPFSIASVETNGTHSAADIAEAMAVNIYPHQNKSVLMVHHLSKPVEPANDLLQREGSTQTDDSAETERISDNKPKIRTSSPDGLPVTPPQHQRPFSMDDVDSPLRNPRSPPEPPAIKFIPATPSGLTPAAEKANMLGNYFGEPEKRPSLVRRAFSLRKNPDNAAPRGPGFLARTLSLSRGIRRETAENPALEKNKNVILHQYPTADDPPPEESKLHPFWRPASQYDMDDDDFVYDVDDEGGETYRYPPVDNRPSPPRRSRSLSERMKRTFAILPVDHDDHYTEVSHRSPERRTIKRTPSGSLRVMRYRDSHSSSSSMRWSTRYSQDERPSSAPERRNRRVWGLEKRVDDRGRRLFPGWQEKLGQYRPQNLQRRLSEHRRQKRTDALRGKISGPREVRDGVGEVIKRNSYKGPSYQTSSKIQSQSPAAEEDAHYDHNHSSEPQRQDIFV